MATEQMRVDELTVKATQEEILERIRAMEGIDVFGEYRPALISYLTFENAKPWLKDNVSEEEWEQAGDKELREEVLHYLTWWGDKVEDGRGISVHRGRAQMINRLFLAGIPLWKEIGVDSDEGINGGWYQQDAYNKVADLFGYPHKIGGRYD